MFSTLNDHNLPKGKSGYKKGDVLDRINIKEIKRDTGYFDGQSTYSELYPNNSNPYLIYKNFIIIKINYNIIFKVNMDGTLISSISMSNFNSVNETVTSIGACLKMNNLLYVITRSNLGIKFHKLNPNTLEILESKLVIDFSVVSSTTIGIDSYVCTENLICLMNNNGMIMVYDFELGTEVYRKTINSSVRYYSPLFIGNDFIIYKVNNNTSLLCYNVKTQDYFTISNPDYISGNPYSLLNSVDITNKPGIFSFVIYGTSLTYYVNYDINNKTAVFYGSRDSVSQTLKNPHLLLNNIKPEESLICLNAGSVYSLNAKTGSMSTTVVSINLPSTTTYISNMFSIEKDQYYFVNNSSTSRFLIRTVRNKYEIIE